MAIYSCNLASVGRTTAAAGTAGAHLRYIARPDAEPVLEAHAIPLDPVEARTWMDREEAADRKNARVIDKIRIALPRELTKSERLELARDFCEQITGNRVPWMLAIHQEGEDAHNPHAHIVVRDRDLETGRRVLRLSDSAREREALGLEPKAVEWIRQRWEACANAALERAGVDERIDRRTLSAQGIDREPTIHLGPQGQYVDEHVHRPQSRKRRNALGREIDYPSIDEGRTRKERQAEIIDLNLERDARSPDAARRARAAFEKSQRALDQKLEREISDVRRRRTLEERRVLGDHRTEARTLQSRKKQVLRTAREAHRAEVGAGVSQLRLRQASERESLRRLQSTLWSRIARAVDITGGVRRRHETARRVLVEAHKAERRDQLREARDAWEAAREKVAESFSGPIAELAARKKAALDTLREARVRTDAMIDARRQLREAARERARLQLESPSGPDSARRRAGPGRER